MTSHPRAKNGLGSRSTHIQRRKFVRKAYPILDERNAMDLWYGKSALYGKVNTRQVPQLISETNLKNILSSPDLMAVDFVVDAFEDLRRYVAKASRRGAILAQDSFMGMMTAKQAWVSPREEYDDHIRQMYSKFSTNYLDTPDRNDKVIDFESFLSAYVEFSNTISGVAPTTFSGFIKSKYNPHRSSGLIIELGEFYYDQDSLKYNRFYKDKHFPFYQNAARKFGFKVDYNCPWRLIADITTEEMREYMLEYGLNNPAELFYKYYYDAFKLEVNMLKKYLVRFYNDFTFSNPLVKKVAGSSSQRKKIRSSITYREQLTEEVIDQTYDNLFWLRFYLDLRETELSKRIGRESKNKKITEMANIMKSLDFNKALVYINDELMKLERLL